METKEYDLIELKNIAKWLINNGLNYNIWLFNGEMGAGKTTLINELAHQMGVLNPTSSPTYSIVNEYETSNGLIYHLDLFRLKDISEAIDAGIEEILFSNSICFIECYRNHITFNRQ
ncbi:MAG: tRNA (adenosine(37)-N6)-threonylcarbamoyltransferase complex ATPase subunit type 1 TsaE [Bacteroidetes bacterium]|nr:tRNA (adenosine(37)-N6)-threonylcarbamoyltransferase complex ATPase subunit type 1 TsaE [Bacteroidota bacterium]